VVHVIPKIVELLKSLYSQLPHVFGTWYQTWTSNVYHHGDPV